MLPRRSVVAAPLYPAFFTRLLIHSSCVQPAVHPGTQGRKRKTVLVRNHSPRTLTARLHVCRGTVRASPPHLDIKRVGREGPPSWEMLECGGTRTLLSANERQICGAERLPPLPRKADDHSVYPDGPIKIALRKLELVQEGDAALERGNL